MDDFSEKLLAYLDSLDPSELPRLDHPHAEYVPDRGNAVSRAQLRKYCIEPEPSPPKFEPPKRERILPIKVRKIAHSRPWLSVRALDEPYEVFKREYEKYTKFAALNLTPEARRFRRNKKRELERAGKIEARGWHNAKWFNRDRTPDHVALELGKVYYRAIRKLPSYTSRPDGALGGVYVELVTDFLAAVGYPELSTKQLRLMIDGRPDEKGIRELIELLVTKRP